MPERMERHMDNDDKIKDLVAQSKRHFLRAQDIRSAARQDYKLDEEFAKTKRNRNPFVALAIVIFVGIFTAGAVLVTLYIQEESKNVPVNIEDFADVNLKEVLDRAKKLENNLQVARRELQDLIAERDRKIEAVRVKAEQDIAILDQMSLSSAEKERRTANIQQEAEEEVASIEEAYADSIAAKEQEIAEIEEALAAYDSQMVEQAKKQEEVLNNQQKKFELQMQETTEYYETQLAELKEQKNQEITNLKEYQEEYAEQVTRRYESEIAALHRNYQNQIAQLIRKYNPVFTDGSVVSVLEQQVPAPERDFVLHRYRSVLAQEGLISAARFNTLRGDIQKTSVVMDRLKKVPYEKSVPQAFEQVEARGNRTVKIYEEMWYNLALNLEKKIQKIDEYNHALNYLIKNSRENGYLLDVRDPKRITVFIDELLQVKEGDTGYVFRKDYEPLGTIRFYYDEDDELVASLVEKESADSTFSPFDKILIEVK